MTKDIIQISILVALSVVAMLGIFSEPLDDSTNWYADFLLSESIGAGAVYMIFKFYRRWVKTNRLLAAYDKWVEYDDENDNPNPMRLKD